MASRGLGTLTLDLIAKIGGFESGMDKAARITDKRMGEIEKRARSMGKALGTALAAGATIAAAGLGLYIKNTIEAEKVQAQLASRIKDTFGAAGRSLEQLNQQASKLQGVTIFDDEAIGGVQAMLLTFKQIKGDVFDAATGAVLDLATAMGTDANAAAVQLGKALNDPIKGVTALAKAGIQFTDDQKKVIKALVETGDIAGAQKIILGELEGQMGTAAEAARDTLGGALQALKNSFDNLLEGDVQNGGLRGARQAVEDLNDTLNDPGVKEGFQTLINGALTALSALAKFAAGTASVAKFIGEEIASRVAGPASGDTVRIDRELSTQQLNYNSVVKALGPNDREAKRLAAEIARLKLIKKDSDAAVAEAARLSNVKAPEFDTTVDISGLDLSGKKKKGAKPKKEGKSDAEKEAERLLEAYQRLEFSQREQIALFGETSEVAALRYELENGELSKLSQLQKDTLLAQAEKIDVMIAEKKIAEELAEINERQVERQEDVLAAINEEIAILGMSAEQQEIYNNLKAAGVQANSAFGESIIANTELLQQAREEAAFLDDLKDGLSDLFVDFVSGAKSAKEAFGDFADDLFATALRFVADKAIKALFDGLSGQGGGQNTAGGGGGWQNALASIVGSFFGGGKASGGGVDAGTMYQVNERGAEMLSISGKDYLMMGANAGRITPNHKLGRGGGLSVTNQFALAAPTDPRTQQQIAGRIAFETSRATQRNR